MRITRKRIAIVTTSLAAAILTSVVEWGGAKLTPKLEQFAKAYWWVIALVLAPLALVWYRYLRSAPLEDEFGLYVESEALQPAHLGFTVLALGADPTDLTKRPFIPDTYVPRSSVLYEERNLAFPTRSFDEREMLTLLEDGSGFLLVGQPTEGKSRTIFELVRRLQGYVVVKPGSRPPSDEAIEILRHKRVVCLFDDINAAIDDSVDFSRFYSQVASVASVCVVAAGCRDGNDLGAVAARGRSSSLNRLLEGIQPWLWLVPATDSEMRALSERIGQRQDTRPYFSLGDVCMRNAFEIMRRRFGFFSESTKDCLWAMQLLLAAGVEEITRPRLAMVVGQVLGRPQSDLQVQESLGALQRDSFVRSSPSSFFVRPADAYVVGSFANQTYKDGQGGLAHDFPSLLECVISNEDGVAISHIAARRARANQLYEAIRLWEVAATQNSPGPNRPAGALYSVSQFNSAIMLAELGHTKSAIERLTALASTLDGSTDEFEGKSVLTWSVRLQTAAALTERRQLAEAAEVATTLSHEMARVARHPDRTLRLAAAGAFTRLINICGFSGNEACAIQCNDSFQLHFSNDDDPLVREILVSAQVTAVYALVSLGQFQLAVDKYDALANLHAKDRSPVLRREAARALVNIGGVYERMGDRTAAIAVYGRARREFEGEADLSIREQVALAILDTGIDLMELGHIEEARRSFVEVDAKYSSDPSPAVQLRVVQALYAEAHTYRESDDSQRFEELILKLQERYGTNEHPAVHMNVTNSLLQLGEFRRLEQRWAAGLVAYRAVIDRGWRGTREMPSEFAGALLGAAFCHAQMNQMGPALHLIERVIANSFSRAPSIGLVVRDACKLKDRILQRISSTWRSV